MCNQLHVIMFSSSYTRTELHLYNIFLTYRSTLQICKIILCIRVDRLNGSHVSYLSSHKGDCLRLIQRWRMQNAMVILREIGIWSSCFYRVRRLYRVCTRYVSIVAFSRDCLYVV